LFHRLRLHLSTNRINRLSRYALLCLTTILIMAGVFGLTETASCYSAGAESTGVYAIDSAQMSQESLTDFVETRLRPLISALPGVRKFIRIGGIASRPGAPTQSAFLDGRRVVGFQADSAGETAPVFDAIASVLAQLHDANQKLVFTSLSRATERQVYSDVLLKAATTLSIILIAIQSWRMNSNQSTRQYRIYAVCAISLLTSIALLFAIPPARNQSPMLITFTLPPGSSINIGEEQAEAARQRITGIAGVVRVFACIGESCPSPSALHGLTDDTLLITVAAGINRSRNDIGQSVQNALASLPGITLTAEPPVSDVIHCWLAACTKE